MCRHVLVALKWPFNYKPNSSSTGPIIAGGIVFEYHIDQNCGLITYFLVSSADPSSQDTQDLENSLLHSALDILDYNAKRRGNLAGCNIILLEAYLNSPLSRRASSYFLTNAMDVTTHHERLHDMGFRLLSFQYVMPPFSPLHRKSTRFMLTVYLPSLLPSGVMERGGCKHLPSVGLKGFVNDLWKNAWRRGRVRGEWGKDEDYVRMMKQLRWRDLIPLLDLP